MEYKYIPGSSNSLFQPFWTGWVKDCRQDLNKRVKGKIAIKTVSWNGRYGQDVSAKRDHEWFGIRRLYLIQIYGQGREKI